MKSDLLKPRTLEIDILVWSGQLKTVSFDEYYSLRLLANAVQSFKRARSDELTLIGQFSSAYEGIYSLFIGCLYLYGVTPTGKMGYREMVVQLACERLNMSLHDRDTLMLVSRHFEAIFCQGIDLIDKPQINDLLTLGDNALMLAKKLSPSWFG